ncbi:hypothetical protein [Pseudomonas fragariae (ex Marin et al. 2024)]|uniref:hypothetical protein n=1 Tax=Pseudomonas fragariae (ex Marin et al. 2024) TaxID=3080056 RepID=UPI003F795878
MNSAPDPSMSLRKKLLSQWSKLGGQNVSEAQSFTLTYSQEQLLLDWYNAALRKHGFQPTEHSTFMLIQLAAWSVFGTAELDTASREARALEYKRTANEFSIDPSILPSLICTAYRLEAEEGHA